MTEKHSGTPLEKAPDPELGNDMIAKERYTDAGFMRLEWEKVWTKVWLVGCLERDLEEPGDYCCT
ncbi:MAG: aromatic ring-hydroxylating dioxygenase subunit alpha, partial [Myxococcota bacterium]